MTRGYTQSGLVVVIIEALAVSTPKSPGVDHALKKNAWTIL